MTTKEKKNSNVKEIGKMALPLPIRLLYWFKLKKDIEKEKKILKNKSDNIITSTYYQFDYYCPHCLFQTNDLKKICPECRRGRLLKTKTKD